MPRIFNKKEIFTEKDYPAALEFAERQLSIFWTPDEIDISKDMQDLHTRLTPAEVHGVTEVLKLFTLYELKVGDYWRDYVSLHFPRPEIQRMAAVFSTFELAIHGPFYNKINELLGFDTEEFYLSYRDNEILSNRMRWIGSRLSKGSTAIQKLKSVAAFSMVEGAVLYSAFAFLKHFNSNGKNVLGNLNAGINFSVNDELIHSKAGAWLFTTALEECLYDGEVHPSEVDDLVEDIRYTAQIILDHEREIIKSIFSKGKIEGITEKQLVHFVESRLDECLRSMAIDTVFEVHYNPIAKWFYTDINSSTLHDFFVITGSDYNRKWIESAFAWKDHDEATGVQG